MTGVSSNIVDGTRRSSIIGPSFFCAPGETLELSVNLPGTPTVTWTLPGGWSGSSTTETISATVGSAGGLVIAEATLACGTVRLEKMVTNVPPPSPDELLGGTGLHLDGSDDYLSIPSGQVNVANTAFTVEFWAKRGNLNSWDFIVSQGTFQPNKHLTIGFGGNTGMFFSFGNGDLIASPTYTDLIWHHWAFVYDPSIAGPDHNRFIYRDGVVVASDRTETGLDNSAVFKIGDHSGTDEFQGILDEFRVWTVARTEAEIQGNLYCPISCISPELELYLPFEDGTADGSNQGLTAVRDYSLNESNATFNNFAQTGSTSNFTTGLDFQFYEDIDQDGFGSSILWTCGSAAAFVSNSYDCDDNDANINPLALEVCGNGKDDNCDGLTDTDDNGALNFDGNTTNTMSIPVVDYTGDFAVEYWFQHNTFSGFSSVFQYKGTTNDWTLAINNNHLGFFRSGIGGFTFGDPVDDGQWHHLVLTYRSVDDNMKIYVDGVERAAQTYDLDFEATAMAIGSNTFGSQQFNGSLDEFRIWDRLLTDSEIADRPLVRLAGDETGLLRYYPFDQGIPGGDNTGVDIAKDLHTGGQDGTLTGFALTGSTSNWVAGENYDPLYLDSDQDGFGGATLWTCGSIADYVTNSSDCDDSRASVNPLAEEICNNNEDDNCNGVVDENSLAMNFDGADDAVDLGTTLGNFGTGDFTIEARFRTDEACFILSKRSICNAENLWNVNILDANGTLGIEMMEDASFTNSISSFGTTDVRDNLWHHFAIVRESNTIRVYIDGVLEGTVAPAFTTNLNNAVPSFIGANPCSRYFKGDIDEIRFWSVARTADEINTYKGSSLPNTIPGLEAYYDFNNPNAMGDGNNVGQTTLTDRMGNYDGTMTGFGLMPGTTSNWIGNSCSACSVTASLSNDSPVCTGGTINFTALPADETSYEFFLDANKNGLLDGGESLQNTASNTYSSSSLNDGDEIGVLVNGCALAYSTVTIGAIPDIAAIGTQMSSCPATTFDLATLTITDNNNVSGTVTTFHSAAPGNATDMSNQLGSTVIASDQTVHVMVANTTTGCFDVANFLVDIQPCDGDAPTILSILRQNPMDVTTCESEVTFRITFSEDVQNVDATDFSLSGTAAGDGTIGAPSMVSAAIYDVQITELAGSNGTINLDIASGNNIEDLASNALGSNPTIDTEEEYLLDGPVLFSILRQNPADATTDADAITFRVIFEQPVVPMIASDFSLSGTAAGDGIIGTPTIANFNEATYDVQITGLANSNGTINLDIAPGHNIFDDNNCNLRNTIPTSTEEEYTIVNADFAEDCLNSGEIQAFAGMSGVVGGTDATGTDATFTSPFRLAIDDNDNLYVGEYTGHTVRKITPGGVVTTLAGASGESGYVDATGSAARFNRVRGLGVDATGNVYVADMLNRLIRKVTPAGEVTTLAGSLGNSGYADGTGSAALFANVSNVAVDASGNLFVVEWGGNNAIRKVTPAGVVTTFAGSGPESGNADGTGGDARFNSPQGLAFDASGNLYVADWRNYLIRKVTPAGEVTTIAGSGSEGTTDGTGAAASFRWPYDIAFDSNGDMYVADWTGVRKVTPSGVVTTVVPASAGYSGVTGIAVDSHDNIYFVANGTPVVWKIGNCPDDTGQLSILRHSPASASTNVDAVTFRMQFAEGVQNVDVTDLALSGTAGVGALGAPTMVDSDPAVYDVPVTGLGNTDGTLNLDIASGNDIQNLSSTALGSNPTIGIEQEYLLDNAAGNITSILRQDPTDALTNSNFLRFRVTFDEDVQNIDASDFVLSGTAAADGTIGEPIVVTLAVYDIFISGVDNSNGTINLDIAPGNDLQDLAGNALGSNPAIGSEEEYTLDNTAPSVVISSTESSPANVSPIPVTVTFSEEVTGFEVGDLSLSNGSASNFGTSDNITFNFDLIPAAPGPVTVDVNADVATDLIGNNNSAGQFSIDYITGFVLYVDMDGDGFGSSTIWTNGNPNASSPYNLDSDDNNVNINPNIVEDCSNNIDDNGNGVEDENTLALSFDGNDDEANLGNTLGNFGTGDFTFEMKLKTALPQTGYDYVLSKRNICDPANFWNVRIENDGRVSLEMCQDASFTNYGTVAGTTNIADDTWHHVAFVRESGILKIYVDGTEEGSGSMLADINNTTDLVIGPNVCNIFGDYTYEGTIDELRFWNVARTGTEIDDLQDAFLPTSLPGLIAYYDFNNANAVGGQDNTGQTTLEDRLGTYSGTLSNFALNGNTSNWVDNPGCGDNIAPSVVISSTESSPTSTSPIPITITFSEEVTGFEVGDLTLSNGSASNFGTSDNTTFTFDLTPAAAGTVTVDVNADVATDLAGNNNLAATQFSIDYSTTSNDNGEALAFDFTTGIVRVPDAPSLDLTSAMTIEFWCKPEAIASTWNVFALKANPGSWTSGYGIYTTSSQLVFMPVGYQNQHFTGYTVTPGQWIHVAATFDGTTSIVYVDGVEVSTKAYATPIPTNNHPLGIGCDQGSVYRYKGLLDEMRIWNRVLSPAEIANNKDYEINGATPGLVANYHFNQGVAGGDNTAPPVNTLLDDSGLGNDGELTGFALTGTAANWVAPGGVNNGQCSITPTPEIAILGGSPLTNIFDGDVTPLFEDGTDFGLIPVNSITDKTFVIRNYGTATLNLTGAPKVELIDNASGFFSITTQPAGNSIATGGSDLNFVVRYLPTLDGTHTATVQVANNDPDEDPYTFVVTATAGTGTPGAALAFNNSNQIVTVPDDPSLDINSEITIEFWCKPESTSGWDQFVMKANRGSWSGGYVISSYNGVLDFDPTGWTWQRSTDYQIPLNQWTHIAATYDGSTSKVYINGSLYSTTSLSGSIPVNNLNLSIGGDLGYSSYSVDGQMDEVRIWNRALSEGEIQTNMNCEIEANANGLVANYHFNEGIAGGNNTSPAVNTLPDVSGFGNNGTLHNFLLTGTESNWVAPGGVTSGTACNITPSPEVDVRGGTESISIANGDNTPTSSDGTDFGTRAIISSTDYTFTIRNIGAATLNLTGSPIVELVDNTSGFFSVETQPAANTIANGGGDLPFVVRYNPTSGGSHTATVSIANDDSDEGPYTFEIAGTAAVIEPGAALALNNRSGEFVVIPDDPSLDISTAITIEFWINLQSRAGYDAYVMKANGGSWRNGYGMVSNGNGQLLYFIPKGWSEIHNTNYTIPLDEWTHIAGTYDGTTSKVYVNGGLISTKSMSGSIPLNDNGLGIGGDVGSSYYGTDGQMDEVRIWNRALSQGEIQANMDCEIPTTANNLVANYHFNQGIAGGDNNNPLVNTLTDASGQGNNGTLTNFLLTGTASNWIATGGVPSGTSCSSTSTPEMDILGGSPFVSIVDGDTAPADADDTNFGIQNLGSTTDHTFTIRNYGNGTLNLSGSPIVTFADNASGFFSVETQPTANSIPGSGSDLTFVVRYAPISGGQHSATVSIANDDADENPYTFAVAGSSGADAFITTWEISGVSEEERTIFIPTTGGGYNYNVFWGDGNVDLNQTGNATHVFAAPGVYTVAITGTLPQFYLNGRHDTPFDNHLKLRSVEQWGTTMWRSMRLAFSGATNLVINATDAPDLSNATDCSWMFQGTKNIGTPDFTAWNVSNVQVMVAMFLNSNFNGNISNWNVAAVQDAGLMFQNSGFDGDLSGWVTSSLLNMRAMFANCSFNGNIGGWNTSNVVNMIDVFAGNVHFNQPINGWTVSNVNNMAGMFYGAKAFNQPLNSWDVSSVTTFQRMFKEATVFNQPLNNWNMGSAVSLLEMFTLATAFNQDINWTTTANVTHMQGMLFGTSSFDQSLANLNISGLPPGNSLWAALTNSGMSTASYDATLIGWAAQAATHNVTGVKVGVHGLTYCAGEDARKQLTNDPYNWTFIGDALDEVACSNQPFKTTWLADGDRVITIFTDPNYTYDYTIDWGDGSPVENATGNISHQYPQLNQLITYTVSISGVFPRFIAGNGSTNNVVNASRLRSVEQWGSIEWKSMFYSFGEAVNVVINATDAPDLSQVTTMQAMFANARSLGTNSKLGHWDVSKIQNMNDLFFQAYDFDSDISRWDVSNVESANTMFGGALKFNQDISSWVVSSMIDPAGMFSSAQSFNQDLSRWDVSNIARMDYMFSGAISFNQNLGGWDLRSLDTSVFPWPLLGVLSYSGLDKTNYDNTLIGWAAQAGNFPHGLEVGVDGLFFCAGKTARTQLETANTWNFVGDTEQCPTTLLAIEDTSPVKLLDLEEPVVVLDVEPRVGPSMKIYPNPTRDQVTIALDHPDVKYETLEIYDRLGRRVWSKEMNEYEPTIDVSLDRQTFTPGLYIVILRYEGKMLTEKLVIIK